jgi:hypothetical protein
VILMENWPKSKRKFWQSLNTKITRQIFEFSKNIENPKLEILKSLEFFAYDYSSPDSFELVACPSDLDINLDSIGFCDLFFPEDFQKLQKGLNHLLCQYYPPSSDRRDKTSNINKWFDDIYQYPSVAGKRIKIKIEKFDFKDLANDKSLRLFERIDIHLKYISPSFIVLSILVIPSDEYIQKFVHIVRSKSSPQITISGFSFKHGITSTKILPGYVEKQSEFENFFMEINKTIVLIFRKAFGVGLSIFGPLPCIEILEINIPLREIPKKLYSFISDEKFTACCQFFNSLGYPLYSDSVYENSDWWKLYEVHRNEIFYKNSNSYQILFSQINFKNHENQINRAYRQIGSGGILDEIHDLLTLLAVEHFYKTLKSLIIDTKNQLEIPLSNQAKGIIMLKDPKLSISNMVRLNGFYFHHSRIWSGVNEKFFFEYMCKHTMQISRKMNGNQSPVSLNEDIRNRMKNDIRFCEEQLSLLRLSYEQILSYKMTTITYGLTKATFLLSILVFFLTIITLVPENIRKNFILNVANLLK